jgi:hypothetical protein
MTPMILVDSNVLLDVVTRDTAWWDWSLQKLETAAASGSLLINDVIYAEISVRYQRVEDLEAMLAGFGVVLTAMPRRALFQAAKAFVKYRGSGGIRTSVLPDFFIGAHAEADGLSLLTRDTRRYRSYFPTVTLIAPGRG